MASSLAVFLLTFFLAILLPLSRRLLSLHRNYHSAKQTGLHVIIVPIDPYGTFWQITSRLFRSLLQHFEWCRILDITWTWEDGARRHERYGENFVVVSPARNIVYTSDKVAVEEVLARRKVFVKPKLYEKMDFYGRNVDTVNGEDWSRHRKITAPCFNERVSGFVWDETVRQSQAMLAHWLSQPNGKVSRMVDDTRIVALHVLYASGFGVQHDFHGGARNPAPGHKLSHRDALMTILNNFITTMIVAPQEKFFDRIAIVLGSRVRACLLAIKEFRQYTDEAIASERKLLADGRSDQKPNLMSTLIRTSDQAKTKGFPSMAQLTDDEIKGNIFIFNVAGHDTTANTLAYAFALLAVHPRVQRWVDEEIDEVFQDQTAEPKYENVHPRLKRIQAVMYETLRIYGPVPQIPRSLASPNVTLTITNPDPTASTSTGTTTTITIPPNTEIQLDISAMQTTSSTYADPTDWNPARWISPSSTTSSTSATLASERFLPLEQGFAAWASGPRICPGMKFSQVEFTGVLSTVLRRAWIAPSGKGSHHDDVAAATREVERLVKDSHHIGATMSMRSPEDVWLRVERR